MANKTLKQRVLDLSKAGCKRLEIDGKPYITDGHVIRLEPSNGGFLYVEQLSGVLQEKIANLIAQK